MTRIALPFPSFADRPLKVLGPDLSDRISRVNGLRRVFRELSITVLSQDLIREGKRPLLCVDPNGFDMRRLVQAQRLTGNTFTAFIGGVDVQWQHVMPSITTH
ncbi:MAG: hypothetical protein ACT4PG_09915 [Panacagrimonas sp.]